MTPPTNVRYSLGVTTVGECLLKARKLRGISQLPLAAGTNHGRANLSVANLSAAKTLGVSVDFLRGLTTDPTPTRHLTEELAEKATRVRDLEEQQAGAAVADDPDYVGVSGLAAAARGGAIVEHEQITGRVKCRREWLARHGLAARECRAIQVLRESMEPTHVDGCSILVNQASRRRRAGRLFVVRTDDGPVVKRAGRDRAGAGSSSAITRTSRHGRPCPGPPTHPSSARSSGPPGPFCEQWFDESRCQPSAHARTEGNSQVPKCQ